MDYDLNEDRTKMIIKLNFNGFNNYTIFEIPFDFTYERSLLDKLKIMQKILKSEITIDKVSIILNTEYKSGLLTKSPKCHMCMTLKKDHTTDKLNLIFHKIDINGDNIKNCGFNEFVFNVNIEETKRLYYILENILNKYCNSSVFF